MQRHVCTSVLFVIVGLLFVVSPAHAATQTITLYPTDDIFAQGTIIDNSKYLRVQYGSRTAYLKFTIPSLVGKTVQSAKLTLQVDVDAGSGTVAIYKGSHALWNENTVTGALVPTKNGMLASKKGTFSIGNKYSWSLPVSQIPEGQISFLIEQTTKTEDMAFSSKEGVYKPTLQLTYTVVATPTPSPRSTPTPTPRSTPGVTPTAAPQDTCNVADLNRDGVVNTMDYSILASRFLQPVPSTERSDINKDGIVDVTDYSLYAANYGKTGTCL